MLLLTKFIEKVGKKNFFFDLLLFIYLFNRRKSHFLGRYFTFGRRLQKNKKEVNMVG